MRPHRRAPWSKCENRDGPWSDANGPSAPANRPMVRCERSDHARERPRRRAPWRSRDNRDDPRPDANGPRARADHPVATCERSEHAREGPRRHAQVSRCENRDSPWSDANGPTAPANHPVVRCGRSDHARERPRRHAQVSRCDHLFLRAWTPDLDGTCFAHDARHDEPTLASIDGLAGHACPAHARLRLEVGAEGWREARLARAEPAAVVARRERVARWWTFKMLAGMLRQPWTQPWRLRLSPAGTLPRAVRAGPAFCRVVVQPRAVSRRMMAVRATSALSPSVPAAAPVE
jgi:hypothetical protein